MRGKAEETDPEQPTFSSRYFKAGRYGASRFFDSHQFMR